MEQPLHLKWLEEHGLNKHNPNFKINGNTITIPIYDENGKLLFNKYRHLIGDTKYSYDPGASATLYGLSFNAFKKAGYVILTEGEAQAAELALLGFPGISTTGGAMTWKSDWTEKFKDRDIYIAYDNDEAGYKATWMLIGHFPNAKVIFIPAGKDLSEYLFLFSEENRADMVTKLLYGAISIPTKTNDLKIFRNQKADIISLPYIQKFIELSEQKNRVYKPKKPTKEFSDAWRNYPIEKYIKFNGRGFANCIFHNEKSPSMGKIPGTNLVHCFGCDKTAGVADVVMQLYGMTFKQAVEEIEKNII
jgi:DNA primase